MPQIKTVRTQGTPPHIPVIEELNATENGTYRAPSGIDGYSPVNVNVPNSYTQQDEGKVVDNGVLVSQSSLNVTQNNTYDTTLKNSVVVDVPNTYTQSDEGKVVSSGALVSQTTRNVTANGTYNTTTNNSVVVNVQQSGASPKAVNFYDYDGTIVQSYSAVEFAELTEMPENPTHNGLTAQGWNWSLVDAKAYVASYGKLDIGQMYTTDDGATRLHIQLTDGRLSPVLGLCPNGTLTIDWGDGTPTETMTGTSTSTLVYLPHTYSRAGEYTISITPTSGSTFEFGQRNSVSSLLCKSNSDNANERTIYLNTIIYINFGNSVTSISAYAFSKCYSLSSITIPNSVTDISSYAFQNCQTLSSITIPNTVTNIYVYAFQYCYSLTSIIIPNSVTGIHDYAFSDCYSLSSITIPNTITSIMSYTFRNCYSLTSVIIPNSVTGISNGVFQNCYSLTSIIIPNSVTSIGSGVFLNCYGLGYLKFTKATPPAVLNASAFSNVPTDCIIYVPQGSLSDYTGASGYPSSSTYQYVEY